jgi:hypothetical protein
VHSCNTQALKYTTDRPDDYAMGRQRTTLLTPIARHSIATGSLCRGRLPRPQAHGPRPAGSGCPLPAAAPKPAGFCLAVTAVTRTTAHVPLAPTIDSQNGVTSSKIHVLGVIVDVVPVPSTSTSERRSMSTCHWRPRRVLGELPWPELTALPKPRLIQGERP